LADQVAPLVEAAFQTPPSQLGGLDVLTVAFGFGQQIYFDFAGYSMIAIGSGRLVGVKSPDNFNWPYLATSNSGGAGTSRSRHGFAIISIYL